MKNATNKKSQPLKKSSRNTIIVKHITRIHRALLDGEKRTAFLQFLQQSNHRNGLYALYNNNGQLYYIGKATDLKKRLNNHLKDKHRDNWDQMTMFFLTKRANVSELEGLLVAAAQPPGNKQKPRIGIDLRRELNKFLKKDSNNLIDFNVYPDRAGKKDKSDSRVTTARLKLLTRSSLAKAIKISTAKLNKLWKEDPDRLRVVRRLIRESGNRGAVLKLIHKMKE
ncbi:MAG: GIY-YIG nuclease family protein [Saprospiraceae bacterium]